MRSGTHEETVPYLHTARQFPSYQPGLSQVAHHPGPSRSNQDSPVG